ncbi:sodium/potassium-transporting ATPase subunit beta-2-like [Chelonus insularis]|uniref:sodium/potassium-transporting ATPase subunit beta-2-like n=1 Tax=Chelonus insularis TaxID=460826 RepID=UPI001588747E|nr:sodium/potassium-transporting ATPase subunit beta-2-like [Chelonus insularis]
MSELKNHVDKNINDYDYMRGPPPNQTGWEKFHKFLYDSENGTVFGKTGKQWGITGLFYLAFLSVLALLFSVCMAGLMATIDEEKPRWTLHESLIGSSPGLGFRPISENTKELALIVYKATNVSQVETWVKRIDDFLENYKNRSSLPNGGENQQICSYEHPSLKPGHVCKVDVDQFGPCSPGNSYGFDQSAPCIFIKLNKIIDWVPEYYDADSDFPDTMPKDLVQQIKSYNNTEKLKTVWVSCHGENSKDEEAIKGQIKYYPENVQGFPGYYYPYRFVPDYLSPLVAVQFLRPPRNEIISVECRAWAKNIKHDKKDKLGMVHFEILIDG